MPKYIAIKGTGKVEEFPDDKTAAEIQQILREKYPPPSFDSINAAYGNPVMPDSTDAIGGGLEQYGNLVRSSLPATGAMAGGVLGAASPMPGGAVIGSTLGGGIGAAASNMMGGDESIWKGLEDGAMGEMGGQVLGQGIINPLIKGAAQGYAKASNWVLNNLPPFTELPKLAHGRMAQWNELMMNMREGLVRKGLDMPDPGMSLKKLFPKAWEEAGGMEAKIQLSNLADAVNSNRAMIDADPGLSQNALISKLSKPSEATGKSKWLRPESNPEILAWQDAMDRKIAARMGESFNPEAQVKDVANLRAKLWGNDKKAPLKWQDMTEEQRALRGTLEEAFAKDLAAHDQVMDTQVSELYQKAVKAFAGKKDWAMARTIERGLTSATKFADDGGRFSPYQFQNWVEKNKFMLKDNLKQDQFDALTSFVEQTTKLAGEMPKPRNLGALGSTLGLGLAYSSPEAAAYLAVPASFSTIGAYSLMSPTGVVRQWLRSGFKPPLLTKDVVKLGILADKDDNLGGVIKDIGKASWEWANQ